MSTSLFRRKRAALEVDGELRGLCGSLLVLGTRTLSGMCESTRAGADVLHPPLVCEGSACLVLGTVCALSDNLLPQPP